MIKCWFNTQINRNTYKFDKIHCLGILLDSYVVICIVLSTDRRESHANNIIPRVRLFNRLFSFLKSIFSFILSHSTISCHSPVPFNLIHCKHDSELIVLYWSDNFYTPVSRGPSFLFPFRTQYNHTNYLFFLFLFIFIFWWHLFYITYTSTHLWSLQNLQPSLILDYFIILWDIKKTRVTLL